MRIYPQYTSPQNIESWNSLYNWQWRKLCTRHILLFGFLIFWLSTYLMAIPETRFSHNTSMFLSSDLVKCGTLWKCTCIFGRACGFFFPLLDLYSGCMNDRNNGCNTPMVNTGTTWYVICLFVGVVSNSQPGFIIGSVRKSIFMIDVLWSHFIHFITSSKNN